MYSNGFSIQDMPVSSAIMSPVNMDQIVHDGKIKMRGWAYSGGGHWPVRVEVSGDGGSVWYEVPYENMSKKYYYAWRLWEIELPVDAEGFCVSLDKENTVLTRIIVIVSRFTASTRPDPLPLTD
jgi:sulfite oxidase